MKKRHTTFYVNKLNPVEFCGKTLIWETDFNAFELPFEIEPTTGEHDFKTCEGCIKSLNELTKKLTEKFEGKGQKKGFPFCCSYHSNLINLKEFNRTLFENVPVMVAKKIIYTNQHIINNHSSENWYKIITDYIEWAVESFGQMPNNCGERLYLIDFFLYITVLLKKNEKIPTEKQTRLLEFLNTYQTPNKNPQTDLNILLATYQKWLKVFPFEINSYFGNLKQHYENQLPIFNGKPEKNIYSGTVKTKMHTKSSLIETLINLTNNLLTQINGVTLYENGLIFNDANKIKLELVISSRKLKLKQGYKNSSSNEEQRYRKILKDWFNDEKKFFDEITPLLKALQPQQNENICIDKSKKLEISVKLIGIKEKSIESINNYNTTVPCFHHIRDVLSEYNIDNIQAKNILLDMQGAYPPEMKKNVIIPIIEYLNNIDYNISINKSLPPQEISYQKSINIKKKLNNKNFSQRQIAIAYCVMDIIITSENASKLLEKHSQTRCANKLIQKRINKVSELTKITENKTTDTKHLNDLIEAKRLISGIKNKSAITDIDRIITAFQTAYKDHY